MEKRYILPLFIVLFLSDRVHSQSIVAEETSVEPSSLYSLRYTINSMLPPGMQTEYYYPGQTFLASSTTTLSTIEFYIYNVSNAGSLNLEIYSCPSPNAWGSLVGTQPAISITSAGWKMVDVSSLNIAVTSGNYYGFKLVPQFNLRAGVGVATNSYSNGSSWFTNNGGSSGTFFALDCSFKITGNTVLPVKLISFTAKKQDDDDVLLQWSTASENNAKNFVLQHSTDQKDWYNIGTVAAAGNSNLIINYQYLHIHPVSGVNYYRLFQTDIDGKSSLSDIRTVQFTNAGDAVFTVMDNPVPNGQLKIRLNIPATLSLYNTNGKLLWKRQFNKGIQYIDISGYSPGVYLLKYNELTEKVLIR